MKISDIKIYTLDAYRTNWAFIKVETDEGLYGWGEASLGTNEQALEGMVADLKRLIVGRNPLEIEKMCFEVYRDIYWKGGPVLMSAISGIEIAMWDIAGKFFNTPTYQLLGGKMREYALAAYEAGAQFIFSPNTNTDIIKLTKQLGLVSIPGAFTPSEVMTAYEAGADLIKLFPITKDDIGYVTGITRPLSHIPFICVGGVREDTIEDFIKAGAVGVGTGISILKPELIDKEDYQEITRLTRVHVEKIKKARKEI